jgi:hypothetical protein
MTKETAEQKLLKALQKKSGTPTSSTSKKSPSLKDFKLSLSIFQINKILLVAIILCAIFLVFQLRSGIALLHKELDLSEGLKASTPPVEGNVLPQPKDVKYYTDSFGNRNIFRPYDISLGNISQPTLAKRLNKYKLVGVAWLDLPSSSTVMIEDTQTKMTYFLKNGEQLEGVTIKTIYTDRVVLSYENEETTIKL